MKKQVLLFILTLLPIVASAEAVEINGIYYNLVPKIGEAEITVNPNKYFGEITVPEYVEYNGESYSVTSIGNEAFSNCNSLTSITIGRCVKIIGRSAFSGCTELKSVFIPDGVTTINYYAFKNCKKLTSVIIPNTVENIESWIFMNCTSLTYVEISERLKVLPSTFDGCSSLASVTIPESVTSLPNSFANCTSLSSVLIPDNASGLGLVGTFYNCPNLKSIIIPKGVTSIGDRTFTNCSSLTSIRIPNSVTDIGEYAFAGCENMVSLVLPDGIKSLGRDVFKGCKSLASINIPDGVESLEGTFVECESLKSIVIPNNVKSIKGSAFQGCKGLVSISLGYNVNRIGAGCFRNCPNIMDVYCYATTIPNTNSNAFENSYIEYATLHVPATSVNAYKAADLWKNFKSIVALSGETPETQKCAKPTIGYSNGKLTFNCETDGVDFVSEITDSDIKKHYDASVSLTATYNICVYATKSGYNNSETATATLCWIDVDPRTDGITDGGTTDAKEIEAHAVLIQSANGQISVAGAPDDTPISIYATDGVQLSSAISRGSQAIVDTNLSPGNIAIVKIGKKSIKVVVE